MAGLAATAVLAGGLALARRFPWSTWAAAVAALLVAPGAPSLLLALLAGGHAFCAARWASLRAGLLRTAGLVAALELSAALSGGNGIVPVLLLPLGGWAAGRVLGERDALAERVAQRARDLEAERDSFAELTVRYERAQIAAELHDIVAHALSVMVVQASAGQRDPDRAAQALSTIADAARLAERDLGRLVALLGDGEQRAEAPDLAMVEQLVQHAAAAGVPVSLHLDAADVPPPVAALGYRVVQEGLTNALRYAAGAPVAIEVAARDGALLVAVVNEPALGSAPLTGTGHGLRGLRERVGAHGGTLEAADAPEGGWRLAVRIPFGVTPGRRPGAGSPASRRATAG
jgi:signal transduction histidine kinase